MVKKEFKTPKFLTDAISRLEEKEKKEWQEFIENHSETDILFAKMYKDLLNIQFELSNFEVMYGIRLEINFKK